MSDLRVDPIGSYSGLSASAIYQLLRQLPQGASLPDFTVGPLEPQPAPAQGASGAGMQNPSAPQDGSSPSGSNPSASSWTPPEITDVYEPGGSAETGAVLSAALRRAGAVLTPQAAASLVSALDARTLQGLASAIGRSPEETALLLSDALSLAGETPAEAPGQSGAAQAAFPFGVSGSSVPLAAANTSGQAELLAAVQGGIWAAAGQPAQEQQAVPGGQTPEAAQSGVWTTAETVPAYWSGLPGFSTLSALSLLPAQSGGEYVPGASVPADDTAPAAPLHGVSQAAPPPEEGVSPEELTSPLEELLTPLLDAKSSVLNVIAPRAGAASPVLALDVPRTQQLLMRLLTTTVRFSPKGGLIGLSLEEQEQGGDALRLRFTIQAHACVLPREALTYFYSGQPLAIAPGQENLALNLALCRNIALMLGGSLLARSAENGGTLFLLDLPARRVRSGGQQTPHPGIGAFSGLHVLLAESGSGQDLISLLEQREVRVERAGSDEDAVRLFDRTRPGYYAAVLTDLRSGVPEAIRALRRPDAWLTPILAVADGADRSEADRALARGIDCCLFRPFAPQELYQMLACFLL